MAAYRETVLKDGPSAYFRLGEASGNAMNEIGGTGAQTAASGTYTGSPTRAQGALVAVTADKAVKLNGTSQYISVPDGTNVDLGDTFTIEMWIRRTAFGAQKTLYSKGAGTHRVAFDATNHLLLTKRGTGTVFITTGTVTNTGPLHIVVTKDGSNGAAVYVNGVSMAGTFTNQTMVDNATAVFIGADTGPGEFFNGTVDEVALYKKVLTAAQVLDHYTAGTTVGFEPDLVVEIALDSNPFDASPVWRNYTEFVREGTTKRGRQQELDQFETGTASVTLLNINSEFDPFNTTSLYNGTLLPMKPLRISFDFYGTRYPLFYGYVESWSPTWTIGGYSAVKIDASDGFAMLNWMTFPDPGAPVVMGTWDNGAFVWTDGAAFIAPNYSREIWAEATANWLGSEDNKVGFRYTNQDGAGDPSWIQRMAWIEIPAGAVGSSGTRYPLELMDGDTGVRDILSAAGFTSPVAAGALKVYAYQETFPTANSGPRITAILDSIGWPAALRAIDSGSSNIQGFTPEPFGADSPLSRLQSTAQAELGQLFMDKNGKVTFHGRHHRWSGSNATIKAAYGDSTTDPAELPYTELTPEFLDVKRVKNDVTITPDGAPSPTRYVGTASITANGRRKFELSVPLVSRSEAENMAKTIGAQYEDPLPRFNSMTFVPSGNAKNRKTLEGVLAREIGDRVQVNRRPRGGQRIRLAARVEGVSSTFGPKGQSFTLQLGPEVGEPTY